MNGDTGGVDLHICGVCEVCTLAVACHGGRTVAAHGVGREEVCVAVTAGGDDHCVSCETLELACDKVLGDDAACALHTVFVLDEHKVVHLVAVVALHLAGMDLTVERGVRAEQELLACLALGVERTAHLCAAE